MQGETVMQELGAYVITNENAEMEGSFVEMQGSLAEL